MIRLSEYGPIMRRELAPLAGVIGSMLWCFNQDGSLRLVWFSPTQCKEAAQGHAFKIKPFKTYAQMRRRMK
jgi:hypothetical protein